MKHPEIFGAIYGLSACCMEWGVDLSPANPGWDKTLDFRDADDFVAAHKFLDSLKSDQEQFFVAFFPLVFTAMSVAWSPDPERPPFFADFPVEGRGASRKPVANRQPPPSRDRKGVLPQVQLSQNLKSTNTLVVASMPSRHRCC